MVLFGFLYLAFRYMLATMQSKRETTNMKSEIKLQLDKVYQTMRANMSKVDLLSMYSHEIFVDFPKNLPEITKQQYKSDLEILKKTQSDLTDTEFNLLTEKQYVVV